MSNSESFDVIVIGAGQAGLSVAYHLKQQGLRFVVLDACARVGDAWRRRWDSLRLFTPARYDGLVGMPFPAHRDYYPTKDEMGDYLEAYAKRFDLPVRCGTPVERLSRRGEGFVVEAGGKEWLAARVVVATASYQRPRLPAFSADLDASIVQLHSSEYKNPAALRPGAVLLVGAGNSGAEVAMDLVKTHRVLLSGRETGHVPFRMDSLLGRWLLAPLVLRFLFHHVLTLSTRMGRNARPQIISKGGPLIRQRPGQIEAAGVRRVARVAGAKDGKPVLDDGEVLDVQNVIWCTGYHPSFEWIDLPGLGDAHDPDQEAGVARSEPGLYFVGLHFQYAMSSSMIHGVGRDAARVAEHVTASVAAGSRRDPARAAA